MFQCIYQALMPKKVLESSQACMIIQEEAIQLVLR